jgi:hypothetical protein
MNSPYELFDEEAELFDEEAENSVLGSMMDDNTKIPGCLSIITDDTLREIAKKYYGDRVRSAQKHIEDCVKQNEQSKI